MKRFVSAAILVAASMLMLGTTEVKEPIAAGVGLQVVPTERGEVVVLAVLRDSPSDRAGLKPGDLIIQVDGQRLLGTDFQAVTTHLLRGKVGSSVELTYQRPGVHGAFTMTLERQTLITGPVQIPGVEMRSSK